MNELFANLPLLMAAPGADPAGGAGTMLPTLVTFGLVFVIFYFLIIRPQNKKQKETKKMLSALKKGDRVVSIGGIHGTIQALKDDTVVLRIDANTRMTFSRSAISNVLEQSRPAKKAVAEAQVEEVDDEPESDTDED
jgi:preprotein translocase subunit YajC